MDKCFKFLCALLITSLASRGDVTLVNGDFENTAAPFPAGWTASGGTVSAVASIVSGGSTSASMVSAAGIHQDFAATLSDALTDFQLDFSFRTSAAPADGVTQNRLRIRGDNNAGDIVTCSWDTNSIRTFNGAWADDLVTGFTLAANTTYHVRVTGRGFNTAGRNYTLGISTDGINYVTGGNSTRFHASPGVGFQTVRFEGNGATMTVDRVSVIDLNAVPELPEIAWFSSSTPNTPAAGTPVALTWSASGADSITLSPGGPPLIATDTTSTVSPSVTTTYTLTATNSGGSVSRTFTVGVAAAPQPLRIQEFMAINVSGLRDEDGDQADWIELYNPAAYSVDLLNHSLTDNASDPALWLFPHAVIQPGGYLVVFASGKNRAIAGSQYHTNFSLSGSGEYLGLHNPDGSVIHAFSPGYGPQSADVSSDGLAYFGAPTPGAANLPGPYLSSPVSTLLPDGSLSLSVNAVDASSVSVTYRVMYGTEQAAAMTASAPGTWTTTLPPGLAGPGEMLRWYFTATDPASRSARLPAFLTSEAPQYLGTVMANPGATSQLRVFEWFLEPARFAAADTLTGARGSVYHLGEFYDNVLVTLRGATTANFSKKPHKFQFHESQPFRFRADLPRVDEINVNAAFSDGSYLRDYLAYRDLMAAGIPTPSVEPIRVQRNGTFHSMGVMIENVDRRFLRRHNLDEAGPLFKATGNGSWLTGTTGFETRNGGVLTDLGVFAAGIAPANANRQTFLFDNTNLPAVVSYLAANVLGSIYNPQKNYYVFRNTRKAEWQIIPWDRDFAYGDIFLGSGDIRYPTGGASAVIISNERIEHATSNEDLRGGLNRLFEAVMSTPLTREMFYRRLRTLLDGHFAVGNIEGILNDWQPRMKQEADLDRAAWGFAPGPGGPYGFRPDNFDTAVGRIRNEYLPARRTYLYSNNTTPTNGVPASATWMRGTLPAAQLTAPGIVIQSVESNPAQGNQDAEYIELRNPTAAAADVSGWKISGGIQHTLQPGTVIPAGVSLFLTPNVLAFRARSASPRAGESSFVQGNYDGHLSNFSELITLSDAAGVVIATFTTPDTPSDVQRFLRISELNFDPGAARPDAEFIEVVNTSTAPLNIGSVSFTSGITFTFPAGYTLPAGGRAVVVYNAAAFAAAYPGNTAQIAGVFTAGRLANGGELIKLDDATGSTVESFTYNNNLPWPPQAAGSGASLARVNMAAPAGDPFNWTAALTPSPGTSSNQSLASWMTEEGISDASADPDGDGYNVLANYALGTDLNSAAPTLIPDVSGAVFTYQRRLNSEGVTTTLSHSTDLVSWTPVVAEVVLRQSNTSGTEDISVRLPAAFRGFCRLAITH